MIDDDLRGRFLAQVFWTELEKIANVMSPQLMPMQQESKDENIEIDTFEEEDKVSPVMGVIGTKIEKKEKKTRAIPIHKPPPGYVFNPELQKFVPNLEMPGWMSATQGALAAAKKDGYMEAKREQTIGQANKEADKFIELRTDNTPPPMAEPPMATPAPENTPMPPPGVMGPPAPPPMLPPGQGAPPSGQGAPPSGQGAPPMNPPL